MALPMAPLAPVTRARRGVDETADETAAGVRAAVMEVSGNAGGARRRQLHHGAALQQERAAFGVNVPGVNVFGMEGEAVQTRGAADGIRKHAHEQAGGHAVQPRGVEGDGAHAHQHAASGRGMALGFGQQRAVQGHGLSGVFNAAGCAQAALLAQGVTGVAVAAGGAQQAVFAGLKQAVQEAHAALVGHAGGDPAVALACGGAKKAAGAVGVHGAAGLAASGVISTRSTCGGR